MSDFVSDFIVLPLPMLVLLVIALIFARRRSRMMLVVFATVVLVVASLPITARALLWPLASGLAVHDGARNGVLAAVVVATAGSYHDGDGAWRPLPNTVRRVLRARAIQRRLGVGLIITGGAPLAGQPPEAATVAAALGLAGADVTIEPTGHNSALSAAAVAALLAAAPSRRVVLVTSSSHRARMAAALRRNGVEVYRAAAPPLTAFGDGLGLREFIPSNRGLRQTRTATFEYIAIAWYLIRGDIRPADL